MKRRCTPLTPWARALLTLSACIVGGCLAATPALAAEETLLTDTPCTAGAPIFSGVFPAPDSHEWGDIQHTMATPLEAMLPQVREEIGIRYERDLNTGPGVKAVDRVRYRSLSSWNYTPRLSEFSYNLHLRTGNPFLQGSSYTTFDSKQTTGLQLDEAYVSYKPNSAPGWRLDLGEFPRPFVASPVYGDMWVSHWIKAGGANLLYHSPDQSAWVSLGTWVDIAEDTTTLGDVRTNAFQAGKIWHLGRNSLQFATGAMFFDINSKGQALLLGRNNGNAVVTQNGKPIGFASGFQLMDSHLDYFFRGVHDYPMAASIEYFSNLASSVPGVAVNGKDGYGLGFQVGELKYPGKSLWKIEYMHVGQDAVLSTISEADFNVETNFDGVYSSVYVPVTPTLNVGLVLERTSASPTQPLQNRMSIDFLYHP